MLNSIYIKNFAIIDELFVEFDKGLNIITGETGSGKTLLVKAIQLILGKRFSREMLKSGKDSIILEGIFNYKDKDIIIRRIYKNNKSRTFIDDAPVSTNKLKSLSNKLADLHGQHDNQNILNTDMHINYLDAYGDYFDKITLYQGKMNKLNDLQKELTNFSKLKEDYLSDLELKEFQIEELTMYPLTQDTYQEVIEKHNFISQSVQIKNSINFIIELIDRSNSSIIKNINQINKEFLKIIKYDDKLETIYDRLESSRINIEDINIEIDNYMNRFHINESEIKEINNQIEHIEMLKRKYGGTIDSILEYREKLLNQKDASKSYDNNIKDIENSIKLIKNDINKLSKLISSKRKQSAKKFEKLINQNFKEIELHNTLFKIIINSDENNLNLYGIDTCEFYISSNIGEDFKPLATIASGGEISRIILAIKIAMQSNDFVDTLVFDEIDTGISGLTAEKVGRKIFNLSSEQQILCITHLSQIASKGQVHFKISKNIENYITSISVKKLNSKDRISEIASLISGINITKTSKMQAMELLK